LTGDVSERDAEDKAIFIEQEEVRAVRTREWLYVQHFGGHDKYTFEDELYNLVDDPVEKHNLAGDPDFAAIAQTLGSRLSDHFARYSEPQYNLWEGGSLKSNSDKPWFWADVWGEDWEPVFDV